MTNSEAKIQARIVENLTAQGISLPVYTYDTIDSTNVEAKRIFSLQPSSYLLVANHQSKGKGRVGRTFYSPCDTGLYMTLVYREPMQMSVAALATQATAVAVRRAILKETKIPTAIKWVNDIYFQGKKVGGILVESVQGMESDFLQGIVIGIGVNLSTEAFPLELQTIAGKLGGGERESLCAKIVAELLPLLQGLPNSAFLKEYEQHCFLIGQPIEFQKNGTMYEGTALSIDAQGGLVVGLTTGETTVLQSGEVSIRTQRKG